MGNIQMTKKLDGISVYIMARQNIMEIFNLSAIMLC